jgi:hypothetical protein
MNNRVTILRLPCILLRRDLFLINKRVDTKIKITKMMKEAIINIVKEIATLQTKISIKDLILKTVRIIETKIFKKKIPMIKKQKRKNASAYLLCMKMQVPTRMKAIKMITMTEMMKE